MSIFSSQINYEGLEEELQKAIKDDALYKLQNDAKIRAVEQRVPTYEHFRQMVNAAHLKPLEQKDTNERAKMNWNHFYESSQSENNNLIPIKRKQKPPIRLNGSNFLANNKFSIVPKDFMTKWFSSKNAREKVELLINTGDSLTKIFATEIPSKILSEILDACIKSLPEIEDSSAIIDILSTITRCNRFQLAVTFMNDQDKHIYAKLFYQLINRNRHNNTLIVTLIELAKQYQVNCTVNED